MSLTKKSAAYLVIFLVLLACCTQESEAVRRVLRGRRTLTRRYFSGLGIPGWLLIVFIALGELLIGVVTYFLMRKYIVNKEPEPTNTYVPANNKVV